MFDPKPLAPQEIRGPFSAIDTNVVDLQFSELLSQTARIADRLAVIRSLTSPLGEHGLANHYLLTGYQPAPGLVYPSFGAVLARCGVPSTPESAFPPYIAIPQPGAAGAGFLGNNFEPWSLGGDPGQSTYQVDGLELYPEVDIRRLQRRAEFLQTLDAWERIAAADETATHPLARALDLTTKPQTREAFQLEREPESLRQRYGLRSFGQSCLLARRLIERDVKFVTVNFSGWDTHQALTLNLQQGYAGAKVGVGLVPIFDQGFSALIEDLEQRGLLAETLVVVMGEFGRTPKINAAGGRDHWPRVFSTVLAGGGIAGGQAIGSSDRWGESPKDQPITPSDLARTIYTKLGIDTNQELFTPQGRPVPINREGQLIKQLV
jgi:hypothetical protein